MPSPRRASSGSSHGAAERVVANGREVAVSNPGKVLFPEAGHTKLDLVRYYLAVADGALRGAGGRPNMLVRYPNGIGERALLPEARTEVTPALDRGGRRSAFPPGRSAEEVVPRDAAALAWLANLALPGAAPASGPGRGSRPSGRAAGGPRPGAGSRVGPGARRWRRW